MLAFHSRSNGRRAALTERHVKDIFNIHLKRRRSTASIENPIVFPLPEIQAGIGMGGGAAGITTRSSGASFVEPGLAVERGRFCANFETSSDGNSLRPGGKGAYGPIQGCENEVVCSSRTTPIIRCAC